MPTAKSSKKKTVKKGDEGVAVVSNNLPSSQVNMREDSGQGLENIGQEDMAIPFLKILEKLSPEVEKNKPERYVEGAEAGDVYDSVNEKLYKHGTGFFVIPLSYKKEDIEWKLRSAGGGLVKIWPKSANIMLKTNKSADGLHDMLGPDTEIIPTAQHIVIVVDDDGGAYPAIISMAKSRSKQSRIWNSKMSGLKFKDDSGSYTPPSYGTIWKIDTGFQSNDKGDWYIWDIKYEKAVEDAELYNNAKASRDMIQSGAMKAKYEDLNSTATEETPPSPGVAPNDNDEEIDKIPF